MVPGEVTELAFALQPISALIPAGYRLRIALAGADVDTFARLPGEGTPLLDVHRSSSLGSYIELPVMPRGRSQPGWLSR